MWNEICKRILTEYAEKLKSDNILYFILRNHKGLPYKNIAKDVDIVVEPQRVKEAKNLLKAVFKNNEIEYYDEFVTGKMICMHGISLRHKTGIHIDLLGGLNIKGYEIVEFRKAYEHSTQYNGVFVLEETYEAFLLLVIKQFGQRRPKLKEIYIKKIQKEFNNSQQKFIEYLSDIIPHKYEQQIAMWFREGRLMEFLSDYKLFNKQVRRKAFLKKPISTIKGKIQFAVEKLNRIVFCYKKNSRTFAVIAPDGTGKSRFMDELITNINYYYSADEKVRLYHFRPEIFPNLRVVGQKAGIKGEKEASSNPHHFRPAGVISSLFRMVYYTMDYILGWQKCIRNDVHYDRYSAFDRYSYDMLVDPLRSRIKLPFGVRKFLVGITPKPKIVFLLKADENTIYSRKQELSIEEIQRQMKEYEQLAAKYKIIHVLDAQQTPNEMSNQAIKILFCSILDKN